MYKIILVEDEEFVRNAIRDIIDWKALGFELVGEAGDGHQALELLEKVQPDVILTDICMPFMDGFELAKRAKEIYSTVKVVIITGYDEFEYAQQAVQLDVSDYILKPITPKEFSDTLKKIKNELDEEFADKKT
ncbi:MAG: response regulator [Clostridia bacterium]|nr:response regulator [Clostridia bacterium]